MTASKSAPPAVWVLFDEYDQEAAIAAGLELRKAANQHRLHRSCQRWRHDANELDRLADHLEQLVHRVEFAYRAAHPSEIEP